jgi:hypothetical protein
MKLRLTMFVKKLASFVAVDSNIWIQSNLLVMFSFVLCCVATISAWYGGVIQLHRPINHDYHGS